MCGGNDLLSASQPLFFNVLSNTSTPTFFLRFLPQLDRAIDALTQKLDSQEESRRSSSQQKKDIPRDLPFSMGAKKVFEAALLESKRMGMTFISPEHVLIALLSINDEGTQAVIDLCGMDLAQLCKEALSRLQGEADGEGRTGTLSSSMDVKTTAAAKAAQSVGAGSVSSSSTATRAGGDSKTPALDEFCRDLCAEAATDKTDPVIGRDKEVARVAQILARRTKNNPILLGEPGVGKTAIAEGLARAIALNRSVGGAPLPPFLANKRVMSLDVGLLMAGAKERGELESRVTKIMAECRASGNIILVIDEVHTLVGAGAVGGKGGGGGGGGGMDISNLLKPALARGELQCIGATTIDEHRKYIEKDAALERRFQPVLVCEPSEAETLAVLEGLVDRYEKHHRVAYSSDALQAAVTLSSRYIADRFLPDKAIDLIDEAGSRVRIVAYEARKGAIAAAAAEGGAKAGSTTTPATTTTTVDAAEVAAASYNELLQVILAKEEAVNDGLWEEATLLRSRELELRARLTGDAEGAAVVPVVTSSHIESVVAAWTGIPVERMSRDEKERVLQLASVLGDKVIGQDEAIQATARAMVRSSSGLKAPSRPIASLLFAGPTGVGKTELTKVLAEHHFGSSSSLIRLDMSEYMERHSVAKLIGAPPGYVGFGEGGKLTEAVRRRPFSLVLFDEVEKAHPDVFNALLQVMEDGRLTDSQGRTVSFKNTLIVLTSNVGSSVIAKGGGGIGFQLQDAEGEKPGEAAYSRVKSLVMEELKGFFRPELLNRLDDVVVFRPLGRPQVRSIADLELSKTAARTAERGIGLQVSGRAMDRLVEEGYSESMGARELRRAVMRLVDDNLSDAILTGEVGEGDIALVDWDEETGNIVVFGRNKSNRNSKDEVDIISNSAASTDVVYSSANA